MKKVFLIAPEHTKPQREEIPIGLLYIASYLKKKGHQVRLFDMSVESTDLKKEVFAFKPNVVGISMHTDLRFVISKISKWIKRIIPECKIVVGGPHPTFAGEKVLESNPQIDTAVKGEGEETFLKILEGENLAEIPGICFRDNNKIIDTGQPGRIDLNTLPIPAYELLNLNQYKYKLRNGDAGINIITSKGCPFRCTFCSAGAMYPEIKFRDPELILEEVDTLKDKFGYRSLVIEDDTFGVNRKYAERILEGLKDRGIQFVVKSRANLLDREFVKKLKETGCIEVKFGVESIVPRIRNLMNKKIETWQIENALKFGEEFKLPMEVYMMIGNYGEEEEDAKQSLSFVTQIRKRGHHAAINYGVIIYPGTLLEERAKKEGLLPQRFSWSRKFFNRAYLRLGALPYTPILEHRLSVKDLIRIKREFKKIRKRQR